MKYFATVNDQIFEIDVDHHGRVTMEGAELVADMRPVSGVHLHSLLLDNASYEIVLDPAVEERNLYGILVGGERFVVKVQDERSRRLALADRGLRAPAGELAVKAPIPGLVVKVAVTPGQVVVEGETLVILEAMKMENELRAPRGGTIHEVRVGPREQVAGGQVLLTIR
jgi:acetyl/propionyl-CoA carboxylase alpha subunit